MSKNSSLTVLLKRSEKPLVLGQLADVQVTEGNGAISVDCMFAYRLFLPTSLSWPA